VFAIRNSLVTIAVRDTAIVMVRKTKTVMVALDMELVSMDCALARMDGEVRTAVIAALVTVSDAAETVNALRVTATATLDGLDMDVIFERVCMTAHNMVIATTELAFAKRDTVVVIVRFLLSLNLASVPSTAYVDVSNSAPRFMRLKELDHHMSATPSAPRSVFLNVLRERCL